MGNIQLNSGEKIIIECKVNKIATVAPIGMIVGGLAMIIAAIVVGSKQGLAIGLALAIPSFILTVPGLMSLVMILARKLIMTNKRVIGNVGLLNTTTIDYPLSKIDSIMVSHSFLGDKFNYSLITIKSTNDSTGIKFGAMTDADKFKNLLTTAMEEEAEKARKAQASAIANALNNKSNKNL